MIPDREMIQTKMVALIERLANSIRSPSNDAYADGRHLRIHCCEIAADCLRGNVQTETLWPDLIVHAYRSLVRLVKNQPHEFDSLLNHEFDSLLNAVSETTWKILNQLIEEKFLLPFTHDGWPSFDYETRVLTLAQVLGSACPADLIMLAQSLEGAYSAGGIPCGWTGGKFPTGRLVVYQPLSGISSADELDSNDPRRWLIHKRTASTPEVMRDQAFGLDYKRIADARWLVSLSEPALEDRDPHVGIVVQSCDSTFLQARGHRVPLQAEWRLWSRRIRYVMPQIFSPSRWSEIRFDEESLVISRSDAAYGLTFNQSSDQWLVFESRPAASDEIALPIGTAHVLAGHWTYQDTSGSTKSLPADWRQWAKRIRDKHTSES